jgi:phosphoglycolate phosphatase-like HAD superfamily hydrolase
MLVVFDLDGTLADVTHRLHYIRPNPPIDPVTGKKVKRRFDLFHHACVDDGVIEPVAHLYRQFCADPNVVVVALSGRDASTLEKTKEWFLSKDLPLPDELLLKSGDQNTPDIEQKRTIANRIEKTYGKPITMVFEDRLRVVNMWKERGTFVFDVMQDNSDF